MSLKDEIGGVRWGIWDPLLMYRVYEDIEREKKLGPNVRNNSAGQKILKA